MNQYQDSEYMDTLRSLIQDSGVVREPRIDELEDIREDYEDFWEENNMDSSEAAIHFMASAGEIAEETLDWSSDKNKFFRAARDALGANKSRAGMILERLSTGDWWYEGVSESDLRSAYENMDPSLSNVR